ncbi:hypothetical protein [Streptomyces sp. SCL15-4]|uniref:hypothetical protein n=1 Tax=Streptomyces sp. SCL15-4 TaxID=2967221 RepID=UPI002966F4C2|nr:hypothetical protein [Streptomyces sp. SCL15-4]
MSAARLPLDALRSAMEQAAGIAATVSDRGSYVRVSVPVPVGKAEFAALLEVLLAAESWGSSDGTGEVLMWAAIRKDGPK